MIYFKTLLLWILFFSAASFAQLPVRVGNKAQSNLKTKIVGMPYSQKMFAQAKVGKLDQKIFMRFNIFYDEFEFISTKKDTLILDKIEGFETILFSDTNKKYQLMTYTDSKNELFYSYLMNIKENNVCGLFKKENIQFSDEKVAKTTLEVNMPARFTKVSDTFFLKIKDKGTSPFPDNKKGIIKLFPDKKEAIDKFFKENKIDFDNENDLKKLVDLIAGF